MSLAPAAPITILTVDDHPIFRLGIANVIATESSLQLVAEAGTGAEAIDCYRRFKPDVTLMDLQMPGMSGLEAIAAIRAEFPHARIVVLTTYEGDVHALHAIEAGAVGYLLKSMVRKELLETVKTVHAGKPALPPHIAAALATHLRADTLTPREVQVLTFAAVGNSNRLIAVQLGISEETVKTYMKNILSKMKANDRTHAVMLGIRRGIIALPEGGT